MFLTEAAGIRIRQGIDDIFTAKEYPKFLSFASDFLNFSCQNIILLYMQVPDAKYVAGLHAWQMLFSRRIPLDRIPALILYPEYQEDSKSFSYSIRKVFDYAQTEGSGTCEEALKPLHGKCSPSDLYGSFRDYFKEVTGKSVYPSADEEQTEIDETGNALTIPSSIPGKDKFRLLFEYYTGSVRNAKDSPVLSGCAADSLRYIIFSYYELHEKNRITFPYLTLPAMDDQMRMEILTRAVSEARRITAFMDASHIDRLQVKQIKIRQ